MSLRLIFFAALILTTTIDARAATLVPLEVDAPSGLDLSGGNLITLSGPKGLEAYNQGSGWFKGHVSTPFPEASTVSVDRARAVAGNPTSNTVVFYENDAFWTAVASLPPIDLTPNAEFGHAVDIQAQQALISAPGIDGSVGAVYIYALQSGPSWVSIGKIALPNGQPGDRFGTAIAFDGAQAIISDAAGRLFFYTLDGAGGWTQTADFIRSNPPASLQIQGDIAVAGFPSDHSIGFVQIYSRQSGVWTFDYNLFPDNSGNGLTFGQDLDMQAGRLIVGSPDQRSAYFYRLDHTGHFQLEETISRDIASFGRYVATDDTRLLIGAADLPQVFIQWLPEDVSIAISDPSPAYEGNSGTTDLVYEVSSWGWELPGQVISVDFTTVDTTGVLPDTRAFAQAGSDYTPTSGTLVFDPDTVTIATPAVIRVPVVGDRVIEAEEILDVRISNAVNGNIVHDTGRARIIDTDRPIPTVEILDGAIREGGSHAENVRILLSDTPQDTVVVTFTTDARATAGTATLHADYRAETGTVTFYPGQTNGKSIGVPWTIDDDLHEVSETFYVRILSATHGVQIVREEALVTIHDNDTRPRVHFQERVEVAEGNSGTTSVSVPVTLSAASGLPITLNYVLHDQTATTADNDYVDDAGVLTLHPGQVAAELVVQVNGDTRTETDEEILINFSDIQNAWWAGNTTRVTVLNDDTSTLSVADVTVEEGDTPGTVATLQVTLSTPHSQPVEVEFSTEDGTAVAGDDYASTSGSLVFAPGVTTQTVAVPVIADQRAEADETFALTLSDPVNATITDNQGLATIRNDDALPALLSPADVVVTEGATGTTDITLDLHLSNPYPDPVSIDYLTVDGTATSTDNDFVSATGTVTFAPGETGRQLTVTVNGDEAFEQDEAFTVELTNLTNVTGSDLSTTITVTNDDTPPVLSLSASSSEVTEGGHTAVTLTLSLSHATWQTVTCDLTAPGGFGAQTATSGTDYTPVAAAITFDPGVVTQTVDIGILDDQIGENPENFIAAISDVRFAQVAGPLQVEVLIRDDDALPVLTLAASDIVVQEGQATAVILQLDRPSGLGVAVGYGSSDSAALANADYTPVAHPNRVIPPGETTLTIPVTTRTDDIHESDETFFIDINILSGATLGGSGRATVTILDDDPSPSVSILDAAGLEGDSGTSAFLFGVRLSAPSEADISVDYSLRDGTATSPEDFAHASGTVTFVPGETQTSISVDVLGDVTEEAVETFYVDLSSPVNATLADGVAEGRIIDDEYPVVSIVGGEFTEGNAGPSNIELTVRLSAPEQQDVQVHFATESGTADASDYTASSGTLTFSPGETARTLTLAVAGDTTHEPDETFDVVLSGGSGVTIGIERATVTIRNDDPIPTLVLNDNLRPEGFPAIAFLSLTHATYLPVSVTYGTEAGTAVAGEDYEAVANATLAFAPFETDGRIEIPLISDDTFEPDETFRVVFSNPENAILGSDRLTITIQDDDVAPWSVYVTDPPSAIGPGDPVTLTVTTTEPQPRATVAITVENAPPGANFDGEVFAWTPDASQIGTYTLTFRATETAGRTDRVATQDVTLVVAGGNASPVADAGPDITLTGLAAAMYVSLDGSGSSDPEGQPMTYDWQIDGESVASGATPALLLPVGTHTITLTVDDGESSDTDALTVTVARDESSPTITILSPAVDTWTRRSSVEVAGTVSENLQVRSITVDGRTASFVGPAPDYTFARSASLPTEGANIISVVATDFAGRSTQTQVVVNRDTTKPVVTIDSPAASSRYTEAPVLVTVTGTVTDLGSGVSTLTVNGVQAGISDSVYSADIELSGNGDRKLRVLATDVAGNRTTAEISVLVDTKPPALSVVSPTKRSLVTVGALTVHGVVRDAGTGVESVTVNGVPATVSGSTYHADVLVTTETTHVEVIAVDAAGHTTTRLIPVTVVDTGALTVGLIVETSTGEPIPGARVDLLRPDGRLRARTNTNTDGLASFGVEAGEYVMRVHRHGSTFDSVPVPAGETSTVTTQASTFLLLSSSGTGIEGVRVDLLKPDGKSSGAREATDAGGSVSFEVLPAASHAFRVHHGGNRTVFSAPDPGQTTTATLAPITLTLVDASGSAITDVRVDLLDEAGTSTGTRSTTDTNGQVRFETLPGVVQRLKVTLNGGSLTSDTVVAGDAVTVQTVPSSVLVVDHAGTGIPNARVDLLKPDGRGTARAQTDASGQAVFSTLPETQHAFKVTLHGGTTPATPLAAGANVTIQAERSTLSLRNHADAGIPGARVDLVSQDGGRKQRGTTDADGQVGFDVLPGYAHAFKVWLNGATLVTEVAPGGHTRAVQTQTSQIRLTDRNSDPVVDARVHLTNIDGKRTGKRSTTDADGRAGFETLPGSFSRFEIIHSGDTFLTDLVPCGDIATLELAVSASDIVTHLRDSHGNPIEGVRVDLLTSTGRGTGTRADTDAAGTAAFTVVPEGEHLIRVRHNGLTWTSDLVSAGETVTVRTVSTSLAFSNSDSNPVDSARVDLMRADGKRAGVWSRTGRDGIPGRVAFEVLPDIPHTLRVTWSGAMQAVPAAPVSIPAGGVNSEALSTSRRALVLTDGGAPRSGVLVRLLKPNLKRAGTQTRTDVQGLAQFEVLQESEHALQIIVEGETHIVDNLIGGGDSAFDLQFPNGPLSKLAVAPDPSDAPLVFGVDQNYPNPFNPTTAISYTIAEDAAVTLTIYSATGQQVRRLIQEIASPGYYSVIWDGNDATGNQVASGVYLYRLQAGAHTVTRKMLMTK